MMNVHLNLIILLLVISFHTAAYSSDKPNVLFVAIDDLNDYITPLDSHPGIFTPNFEKLAKRSVTFANAHCAAPACHPSRVAVMTGVHPVKSGIYRNMFGAHGPRWRHESPILEKAVVLSQHFRDHGYTAAGGGKIFHTLQWTPGDSQNDPQSWDIYRGDPLDPISMDWPRPNLISDSDAGLTSGRPLGGSSQLFGAAALTDSDEQTGDHMVVDWAINQMNMDRENPLFLAVGLFRPHIPWEVPQKWFDLYPTDRIQIPSHRLNDLVDARSHGRQSWHKWVLENGQWKNFLRGYLASISYVDHQLGRLIDALDASPLKGNTIIIVWSDHGFHIGEKENWEKFALWDQTTRVPLFIHAPGKSHDGSETRAPVTLTDLYPTLCELAGLPIPSQCTGVSLMPQLSNPAQQKKECSLTSFQFWGDDRPSHAVSDPRYRLIQYADGFEELYDLQEDPNEFDNRIDDPKLRTVRNRLASALPSNAAHIRPIPTDSPFHQGHNPSIAGKNIQISLSVHPKKNQPDGVLVSHGGEIHGYSLFVKNRKLHFAVRLNGEFFQISSRQEVPSVNYSVQVNMSDTGEVQLFVDFVPMAYGKFPNAIVVEPKEPRNFGSDDRTAVGTYTAPFAYKGRILNAKIHHHKTRH